MATIIHDLQDMRYLEWTHIRHSSGTAGSFLKAYDDLQGVRTYYKLSDYDSVHGITGHECINEIIVDRLLSLLAIDHLPYTLMHARIRIENRDTDTWLCASENFRKPEERKIALEEYFQAESEAGESPLEFCTRMGWASYIYTMFIVDYLILNRDRHGANIEVLQNRKTRTLRLSPLFDHGLSLLCSCRSEEEAAAFDVTEDKKIQSFAGTRSASDNLKLVPYNEMKKLPVIKKIDVNHLTDGMEEMLPEIFCNKIREMVWKRWCFFETLRNT